MLKIIGRDTSSNVQKVLWVCGELDLTFHRKDLGGPFGGNDDPEYRAINPNGKVPTIIDGDFVMTEEKESDLDDFLVDKRRNNEDDDAE